jgi:hypothetical protein
MNEMTETNESTENEILPRSNVNAAAFFDYIRKNLFGGSMTQSQVEGCQVLGSACQAMGLSMPIEQTAYVLATAYHETARTMQPIEEFGGWNTRYAPWYGRGHVQLTWESNYKKQQEKLSKLDFVRDNDIPYRVHDDYNLALVTSTSAIICVGGMRDGDFTGKGLDRYINPNSVNYVEARRIVNGTDKAQLIAGYATKFEFAVRLAVGDSLPAPTPPKKPKYKNDLPTIKKGSKTSSVVILQQYLGIEDDGIFGNGTKDAVKKFQKENKLDDDGVVGKNTWYALIQNK